MCDTTRGAQRHGRRDTAAFTLVELLVVVTVIALLVAILVPAYSRMLVIERRAMCASQLHQYSLAMHNYLVGHHDVFPSCHSGGSVTFDHTWLSAVYAYGAGARLGRCPAIQGTQSDYGVAWNWQWGAMHNGYGFNMWFLGGSLDPNRQNEYDGTNIKMEPHVRLLSVQDPANCLMIADTNPKSVNGADYGCTISLFWPYAGPDRYHEGVCDSRHDNAGVVVFVDGNARVIIDPNDAINPPYCGARKNLEYWDNRQRLDLGIVR